MKLKHNQSGFSMSAMLLIIIAVAIIGFGGWYVWHSNKADKHENHANTLDTSSSKTDAQKGERATAYLTLAAQRVHMPRTSELSDIQFGPLENSEYNTTDTSVAILAPQLDAGWSCEPDALGNKGSIGSMSITIKEKRAGPGEPAATKKIGNFTYGFEPGGQNCTTNPEYSKLVAAFKAQFTQLEQY